VINQARQHSTKTGQLHHDHYGVRAEHYASVGAALMWTLERGLGFDFAPDVREAWVTAYNLLSSAMIAASSQPLRGAA
jgi:nitric oxide dioxygenase